IVLSSCGIFSSCFCWSSFFTRSSDAHVILDDSDERERNEHTFYPGFVSGCLALQFLVFAWMLYISRHGSPLFRRNEKKKQEDWLATHERRGHLSGSSAAHSRNTSVSGATRSRSQSCTRLLDPGTPLSTGSLSPMSRAQMD